MINFYEFLNILNETLEKDIYQPHPDNQEPDGGSSHHIYRLKDKEGKDYWSKSAASDLQTINEYLAWKIYKLFNLSVPSNAKLVLGDNNKLRLVMSSVSGNKVPLNYDTNVADYLSGSDIHKGFLIDAFLGHWDVVGSAPRSNLFIDDQKRVTRIDLGGMDFRAQGARKSKTIPGSWGPEVGELQTMGGLGGDPVKNNASAAFGDFKKNKQNLKDAIDVFNKVNWQQIENEINNTVAEVYEITQQHGLEKVYSEAFDYISEVKSVLKSRYLDIQKKLRIYFSECLLLSGIDVFCEEVATYDQIEDKQMLYKTYYDTYSERGLKPWSQSDFEWRAENWTYAGVLPKQGVPYEQIGFVTTREKNGIYKLTGMQGPSVKGKIKGLMELAALGKPIWGAMDKEFTEKLKKLEFSSPPRKIMSFVLPVIQSDPQFSSGGSWGSLNDDGGVNFDLSGVGSTVKYFTANKAFYRFLIDKLVSKNKIDAKMLDMLKKWKMIPQFMKKISLSLLPKDINLDVESLDWLADQLI